MTAFTVWQAYKLYRSRPFAVAAARLFRGIAFLEAVSGHPGMTARMVYPGWTRVVDGVAGTVSRTRNGAPAASPWSAPEGMESEVLQLFYDGVTVTHRENPQEFYFSYKPAQNPVSFAVKHSLTGPGFLRGSDCCSSLMRVPDDYPWAGAYWGNHNSRDNLPDLGLGVVAAMEAAADEEADPIVREAAALAVEAGRRIGDLVQEHAAVMTVDEHHGYDELNPSGTIRPDGLVEEEDLGTLSDCAAVYLSRAISTAGLALPVPELPVPGSIEKLIFSSFGNQSDCEFPGEEPTCTALDQGYCGRSWDGLAEVKFIGQPWLDVVRAAEKAKPGGAESLIGSFQDDFYEKASGLFSISYYARIRGDDALRAEAEEALHQLVELLRELAEIIFAATRPEMVEQRGYELGLVEAYAGLPVAAVDFASFAIAERRLAAIEALLDLPEATPKPLLTDEQLKSAIESRLAAGEEVHRQRYRDAYGDQPPIRRAGDVYEARGFPEAEHPWRAVPPMRHEQIGHGEPDIRRIGNLYLFDALPLCTARPDLLDCRWAALGCARVDLNDDGEVDEADRSAFDAAPRDTPCGADNEWCGGADLDRSGEVGPTDEAFLVAATGCRR